MPVSVIGRHTGTVTVTGTTAETDLLNQTIPGGLMGTDRMLRITLAGARFNNSTVAMGATVRLYLGTVLAHQSPVPLLPVSTTWAPMVMMLWIGAENATTLVWGMIFGQGAQGGATVGIGKYRNTDQNTKPSGAGIVRISTVSVDTTVPWTVRWTVQHGSSSSRVETRRHWAVVELL
jgi:hypothetical protein